MKSLFKFDYDDNGVLSEVFFHGDSLDEAMKQWHEEFEGKNVEILRIRKNKKEIFI